MRAAAFLLCCTLAGLAAGTAAWRLLPAGVTVAATANDVGEIVTRDPGGLQAGTRAGTTDAGEAPSTLPRERPPPDPDGRAGTDGGRGEPERASGRAAGQAPISPVAGATGATGATGPTPARPPDGSVWSYHDGIMRATPSVVSVYTRAADNSQGSGVVVGADGIVLTNLHLVDGAERIGVQLSDGSLHEGALVGSDAETDLAVLQIDAGTLPALALDAAPPLRVGDVVLAIGNPFGFGQTVTQGIVSATRRRVEGGSAWQNFVQIDAAINPGSSGGALVDPLGRLVGVTTAVLQREGGAQGIGFAIPAELLAQVVPQIVEQGRVLRGWLGIGADDLAMFPDLARSGLAGAVITDVLPGSPAQRAGLTRRDVVASVDGRPVTDATGLLLTVSALPPGRTVALGVTRAGTARAVDVTLGERPAVAAAAPGGAAPDRAAPDTAPPASE